MGMDVNVNKILMHLNACLDKKFNGVLVINQVGENPGLGHQILGPLFAKGIQKGWEHVIFVMSHADKLSEGDEVFEHWKTNGDIIFQKFYTQKLGKSILFSMKQLATLVELNNRISKFVDEEHTTKIT